MYCPILATSPPARCMFDSSLGWAARLFQSVPSACASAAMSFELSGRWQFRQKESVGCIAVHASVEPQLRARDLRSCQCNL
mmetsp:Transcript_913/g.2925  ORF Transcript_913/g.2925 Transcript_913/m.2925 type:complete len:81 (+) Transcript_913:1570-1812(+)